jgi:hypothetical protein
MAEAVSPRAESGDPALAMNGSDTVLDRVYGRAKQSSEISGPEGRPLTIEQLAVKAREHIERLGRPGAVDVAFSGETRAGATSTTEAGWSAGGRVLSQPPTVNDCVRSAVELSPAYTSMLPGSTTNLPLLS